jgi:hypothetical protein
MCSMLSGSEQALRRERVVDGVRHLNFSPFLNHSDLPLSGAQSICPDCLLQLDRGISRDTLDNLALQIMRDAIGQDRLELFGEIA